MRISTKGRYALRMLLDLAEHREQGYTALKEVAQRQNISQRYLEQILPLLAAGRLLQAQRGAQGGYRLARNPADMRVGDILRLTEGDLCPVACLAEEAEECERRGVCTTLPVWKGLERVINDYLDGITLADILRERAGEEALAGS